MRYRSLAMDTGDDISDAAGGCDNVGSYRNMRLGHTYRSSQDLLGTIGLKEIIGC